MGKDKSTNNTEQQSFPPVVAVLGHVDHGKTTLLDTFRKTSIAAREVGGITQKIGASEIEFLRDGQRKRITFIDTPGHEAFSQMRGRGAQAADLGLLIIAATESVKPQTKESIKVLKETNTPFIVVLTKADLPTKNTERVKQDLLKEQVMLEDFGGEIPSIEVSAKSGLNIPELLDLILLMFDMHKSTDYAEKIRKDLPLKAIVIESKLDPKAGPRATLVIKNGSMKIREEAYIEGKPLKIRSIINDKGQQVPEATIGDAVEVLGFETVPSVGSIMTDQKAEITLQQNKTPMKPLQKELIYQQQKEHQGLSVIVIADTQGSLEAILNALPNEIKAISAKTGEVNEADILMAKSTGSIVLSFNTKVRPDIQKLAMTEKVLFRNYTIIYELLDEIKDALEGKLLAQMEQILGVAQIMAKFPFEKSFAYGIKVQDGRIARSDRIRIQRGETILGETTLASLRVAKNPVSKVEKGHEAGIVLTAPLDISVGDVIISHS
jgi:translation initiation factor IF-2